MILKKVCKRKNGCTTGMNEPSFGKCVCHKVMGISSQLTLPLIGIYSIVWVWVGGVWWEHSEIKKCVLKWTQKQEIVISYNVTSVLHLQFSITTN